MTREIPLSQGEVALVDDADWKRLSAFRWSFSSRYATGYVTHEDGSKRSYAMHRFIMNAPQDMVVHHRNGNPLDNRRDNLRVLTRSEHGVAHRRENIEYDTPYRNENGQHTLRLRVTPAQHEAITTLSVRFDMTLSAIVRCAIVLMLGDWTPFTAGEAQEVLREAADGE